MVLSAAQGLLDNATPLIANISEFEMTKSLFTGAHSFILIDKAVAAVDLDTAVGAIVDLLANAKVDVAGLVGVDISADVTAIVDVTVKLIVVSYT